MSFFFFRGISDTSKPSDLGEVQGGPLLVIINEVITPTNGLTNWVDGVMTPISGAIGSYL